MCYALVIEQTERNYSAYVRDLPGCVATGSTIEEVEAQIREAIVFHLEGLREDGIPLPHPASHVEYVERSLTRRSSGRCCCGAAYLQR